VGVPGGGAGDVRASGSVALAPSSGAAGSPNSVGPGGLSFNHLIRPLQERRRDRQAEIFRHAAGSDQIVFVSYLSCGA